MTCKTCGSDNLREFRGEIGIHLPGLKNVDKPAVVMHPNIVVCLKCGIAEIAIPETERRELALGGPSSRRGSCSSAISRP